MAVQTIKKPSKYVFGWEGEEKEFTSIQELKDYINGEASYLKVGFAGISYDKRVRSYLDIIRLVSLINSEGNYSQFNFIVVE